MQKHRVRKPKRRTLPKGEEVGFQMTREVLQKILRHEFLRSQATLADATGYSLTLVFRVMNGERPPTPEFVGAVLKVIRDRDIGVELLTAFLSETASSVAGNYSVSLEVRR